MGILTIDIGGTDIKYGLIENDLFLLKDSFKTPDTLKQLVERIEEIFLVHKDRIEGLAFSVNALTDNNTGRIIEGSSNEYLNGICLSQMLKKFTGEKKITLYNDAKCAALAEIRSGSLKGVKNGLLMSIGTGIGGAVVLDYKLMDRNHMGELSYLPYKYGFAWQYLKVNQLFKIYEDKTGRRVENGLEFFKDIESNSEKQDSLMEYIDRFLPLLQMLVCTLDPNVIALGGGISRCPQFIDCFKKRVKENPYYSFSHLDIRACRYGNDANLLGAYDYYLNH